MLKGTIGDAVNYVETKADENSRKKKSAVVDTVDLTEENYERAKDSLYNDASFADKFSSFLLGAITPGKTREDFFAESRQRELIEYAKEDYYENNMSQDEKNSTQGKTNFSLKIRNFLINNMGVVLLVVVILIIIFVMIKYMSSNKVQIPKKKQHTSPTSLPCDKKEVTRTGHISINYERGVKFYCDEHGIDPSVLLSKYGSYEAAFKAISSS